jgi:hypothetical protein
MERDRLLAHLLLAGVLLVCTARVCPAQWSTNPATNASVADGPGDQVQPKVAPTPDGGAWISWFDSIANGFDVRVQKLDAAGNEVLPHNGVLVADRGFSSTQDYGLDVDASGNALLTFRDNRGTGIQITAAQVTPAGAQPWGASGIQLTNTTDFVAAPKIAGTTDGGAVVAWTQDATVRIQKLDATGTPQWVSDVVLTPGAGSYSASDLHDSATDAILSFVHQTGDFGSPRHLLTNKLDASGALLWSAGHVAVFDGGSLQIANFPPFVPDGSGGAVFSWYDTSGQLQCSAQRILTGGTEAFPHNGTTVSTNATRLRVSPAASFDPAAQETYVFWEELNSTQSQSGLYGQKLDAGGTRQWGNDGKVIVSVGSDDITMARTFVASTGVFAFWSQAPSFGQDEIRAARLTPAGVIDLAPYDVASTPSDKSRLALGESTLGFAILAWTDDRVDAGDVLAQNVNADGTLGGPTTAAPIAASLAPLALAAHPNPSRGAVRIEFSKVPPTAAHLDVYDLGGRRVRALVRATGPTSTWNGLDEFGRTVPPGVYFIRLEVGEERAATKVVRIAR